MKNARSNEIVCASCGPVIAEKPIQQNVSQVAIEDEDLDLVEALDIEDIPEEVLFEDGYESATNDITAVLGEYLLKGWVMMNECCPKCNVPLMRTKDSSTIKCFQCNVDVIKEAKKAEIAVIETPQLPSKKELKQTTSIAASSGDFVANMNRYLQLTSQKLVESCDFKEQEILLGLITKAQDVIARINISK